MPAQPKHCYRCGQDRPPTDFITKRNGASYDMCSPCLHEILTAGGARGKKARLSHTATDRVCYLCRATKPNAAFTRRTNGSFFSACKDCNLNVFAHRRRARMLSAEGSFSTEEWVSLLALHPACPRCARRWEDIAPPPHMRSVVTRDHIVAVSRGGSNDIGNIQPLCFSCNSRKGDR